MRALEKNIRGFNLLELLVVIVIISVISAVAYPNFSSWRKEREVRGAAVEIKNLFTNISSQVQRGMYAFVQVDILESSTEDEVGNVTSQALIITSKGMHMNTMMANSRDVDNWTTDVDIRCDHDQAWDDEGSPTNKKLEVAQLVYDNIASNFSGTALRGTVCFSKDGTYYGSALALKTETFFYICGRRSGANSCSVSDTGVPDDSLVNVFAINWSRFGNITLEKWSKTKGDWVLQ